MVLAGIVLFLLAISLAWFAGFTDGHTKGFDEGLKCAYRRCRRECQKSTYCDNCFAKKTHYTYNERYLHMDKGGNLND